jgi:hypothetical protein
MMSQLAEWLDAVAARTFVVSGTDGVQQRRRRTPAEVG